MNLYLIGYRGSGKSTVAQRLSDRLQLVAVDTDALVEKLAGTSISEIFASQGEASFRKLESQVLRSLPTNADQIISLGGGAPLAPSNRDWLKKTGKTIWLMAPATILWKRIRGDHQTSSRRPDLTNQGGLAEVQQVLAARTPVYADCADYALDVGRLSPEQIVEKISDWWNSVDRD